MYANKNNSAQNSSKIYFNFMIGSISLTNVGSFSASYTYVKDNYS